MTEKDYSPMTDAAGCVVNLYGLVASIVSAAVYLYYGADYMLKGDILGFLFWAGFLGPIVSGFVGILWPIFFLGLLNGWQP